MPASRAPTYLGLTLGMPQVALPGQSEQSENARRVAAMGVAIDFSNRARPRNIADAITQVYADAAMAQRARDVAKALRPDLVGDTAHPPYDRRWHLPAARGMTSRVMLAWEGGAGRGHISTLRSIAQALDGLAICDAAINDM